MKTVKIVLADIKSPDGWGQLIHDLVLDEEMREQFFEFREYASLELEIDENLKVVGGRVLPLHG